MSYGRAYRERDLSRKVSAFAPNSKAKYVKPQGNRIKKTRKINDLGITRVLAYVYI